jgi:hypothetical protein
MKTSVGGALGALLDQPVFDSEGRLLGHVAAIGTRHGELRSVGIEGACAGRAPLQFVDCQRFKIERDRIILTSWGRSVHKERRDKPAWSKE